MATTIKLTTVKNTSAAYKLEGYTAPTQNTAGAFEDFCAAIEAADGKGFFVINNEAGTSDVGVSLIAGDYVGAADTAAVTVAKGETAYLFADSALCKADGMLNIRLTPSAGAALSSGGVKLAAVQLLPVINH